ncbi:hypothetical protein ACTWKD_14395, partial [Halanaerobium saccharolyticum]|uniref:hypothetical protein n=1 Tax=Halanaerobium saccharolyticum TaxID=43595 RepID=UPI003FCE732D
TVIERIQGEIFTPDYIRSEVAHANALLAAQSGDHERTLRQAEAAEKKARQALERLTQFVASHATNAVVDEQYRLADREWRLASAALTEARNA